MKTKCLVFSLWLQLFIGLMLWNDIKCDCQFPEEEIINGEYIYANPIDEELYDAEEEYILFFNCSVGYDLIGASAIQCLNGKWSGKVPTCKAMQCGAPQSITNGTYTVTAKDKTEVTIGTQAIYSCSPGYELSDPTVSRLACILNRDGDGTLWAGDTPACQAMKPCSDPGFSLNGSREGDCCLPGNIVSYSCNEGFEMVGDEDIECLWSRQWSSPRPLCRPLRDHCELPPQIPNGVVMRKSGDYALPDEEVEILCKPGYKFNGPNQYPYCNQSALWEDEFGECVEIICDRPKPLANGVIPELEKYDLKATFSSNFVLTYDCNEGYRLKGGDPWRVCTKDGWSGTDPVCEEIFCPDPVAPQQGNRQGDSFKVGAKVRFKCFTGYELLGSVERYCGPNGKWTGKLARCNAPTNYCPNPGIPINGLRNGESYDQGNTVEFRCRSGFIQSGSKQRTCMADRTWNGTETKCLGPHDFDNIEEIARNLKHRLDEQFDEDIREYKMRLAASGLTGEDGRALDIPSNDRLIMYFAFDVSGSIHMTNFKKGIKFAKALVEKIGVSENGARVGALTFSKETKNVFFPMQYQNTKDVLNHLDIINYTGGGTSATSALEKMIENVRLQEDSENFDTTNSKTVLFLITDGKANMGGSPENEAETLKKMKVEIFCIGITGDVRADALYQIASTSKYGNEQRPNVFILKNYERLDWLVQDLTNGTIDYAQCGIGMESKVESNDGKMVGGELSVEPWPWMATLFFRDLKKRDAKPQLKCGASIISDRFILTAAHCLFQKNATTKEYHKRTKEEIIVKLGLVELKNETFVQEFDVETIYIHHGYVMSPDAFFDNDIALLKLNRPITYGPFVRPVCLPPAVSPSEDNKYPFYKPNEYGWVIGFGYERQVKYYDPNKEYKPSKQLKQLRLQIQSNATCSLSQGNKKGSFTERMFCAGDGKAGNDTCKGDSGGPFMQFHMNAQGVIYWTQVGIVSWGKGCGVEGRYGFYTNVQRFRGWIDKTMKEAVPNVGEA